MGRRRRRRGRAAHGQRAAATDGGMLAGVPPTPELLAKVAALPPANDTPDVDQAFAARATRTSPCAGCCGRSRSR